MLRICMWAVLVAIPVVAFTDSIKVGEEVYNDVYIDTDEEYYYVRFPDTGTVEKVSRKRQDVSEPKLDENSELRSQMLKRFEANKAKGEKEVADIASQPASQVDNEAIEEAARVKSLALFDAQVEYWKDLPEKDRDSIEDYLFSLIDTEDLNYAIVRKEVVENIVDLEAEKARHEVRIAQLAQLKNQALAEARRLDRLDLFMQIYQASVYDFEAAPHGQAINSLNDAIVDTTSAGIAENNKSVDQRIRIGTFLARLDQLTGAVKEGYVSPLEVKVAAEWKDSVSQETAPFTIAAPLWRLDCRRDDLGDSGSFSITVYDDETKQPFTKIAGVDFLQMRVRILDGPGRYYLKIEQDSSNIPYEIKAVTFSK